MVHNCFFYTSICSFSIIFLAQFTNAIEYEPDIFITAQTDKGRIRGTKWTTVQSRKRYSSFESIPYAKPPIGYGYRFRRPVPMDPWETVKSTVRDPPACPYWTFSSGLYFKGNEDCLYLNVYTPERNFTSPGSRAVMVFIHGGAFQWGKIHKSEYGPDFLIEKDVVVVLMNYRLGIFGFLSLGIPQFHNNVGLWDQVEALKWVQNNIAYFGGDPKRVTIFGESAGAVSVELLKLAPQHTQGLFRASIAMSGSALNNWGFLESKFAVARGQYARNRLLWFWLGNECLYKRMIRVSMGSLLSASFSTMIASLDPVPFRPSLEQACCSDNPFITKKPEEIYRSGKFVDTPHILGFMKDEGVAFLGSSVLPFLLGSDTVNNMITGINTLYFIEGIDRSQRYLTTYGKSPVYYYRNSFDYEEALHKIDAFIPRDGSAHADDLAHVFWIDDHHQSLNEKSDIGRHREKMVTMWTNFAKYLNPTPKNNSSELDGIEWQPSSRSGRHLELDKTMTMGERPTDADAEWVINLTDEHVASKPQSTG